MSTMESGSAGSTPRLNAPEGACDTHMHFYDKKYPLAPTAASAPPENGSVDTYRALQRRVGLTLTVVVQPTAYGKDNSCTLDGMAALGETPVSLGYDKVRFLGPVFIGDTVTLTYTIVEVDAQKRQSVSDIKVVNQNDDLVAVARHVLRWVKDTA